MEEIVRFGVSVPRNLLEEFTRVSREVGFANRSEAIRAAMRLLIMKEGRVASAKGNIGVIIVLYSHGKRGCEEEITEAQHDYSSIVVNSSHIHLGEDCLEVITCRGGSEAIKELYRRIESIKGVKWADLLLAPVL
ncbi:MAG: nickel-responsive transcriptional regulator NikR [Thermoproteota archaeon]|nr:MAG: nickel-responsive transcriptional regulator NikR [Candidatus Korarchaeota archaeon]